MFRKIALVASVVACVPILVLGVAAFIRARNTSASNACINNLRQLDGIKQQWALENHKTTNDIPTWETIRLYLPQWEQEGRRIGPLCPQGGTYSLGRVGDRPTCSIGGPDHTLQ
jgi:hypothetical protein